MCVREREGGREREREKERVKVRERKGERVTDRQRKEKEGLRAEKRKGKGIVMQMQLCFLIATSKGRKNKQLPRCKEMEELANSFIRAEIHQVPPSQFYV
jgi:hypothetical protein